MWTATRVSVHLRGRSVTDNATRVRLYKRLFRPLSRDRIFTTLRAYPLVPRHSARPLVWQLSAGPRPRDSVVARDLHQAAEESIARLD